MKIVVISGCEECPHYVEEDVDSVEVFGIRCGCYETEQNAREWDINEHLGIPHPDWCPLRNAEDHIIVPKDQAPVPALSQAQGEIPLDVLQDAERWRNRIRKEADRKAKKRKINPNYCRPAKSSLVDKVTIIEAPRPDEPHETATVTIIDTHGSTVGYKIEATPAEDKKE